MTAKNWRIGIIAHPKKPEAQTMAREVAAWLAQQKNVTAEIFTEKFKPSPHYDLVVVLSGDGYLIHTASALASTKIPILGINAGDKGFLTIAGPDDWREVLSRVIAGSFAVEKRLMLDVLIDGSSSVQHAANDVYLRHPDGMVVVKLEVDEKTVFNRLVADGVVIATPIGSTAYNMSAGGPIVMYSMDCLLVTPVAPIALNAKPIVISPNSIIRITLVATRAERQNQAAFLKVDGSPAININVGQTIVVRASQTRTNFISFGSHQFIDALHQKAGLLE
ncbi:MAG: NAD(+)/NADH kinase [Candidatus Spechtbacteria bacterium]|nr:NAD(+)/NADH kinase [Candidatus Spechtbacteria bacterium]